LALVELLLHILLLEIMVQILYSIQLPLLEVVVEVAAAITLVMVALAVVQDLILHIM